MHRDNRTARELTQLVELCELYDLDANAVLADPECDIARLGSRIAIMQAVRQSLKPHFIQNRELA